VDLSVRLAGAAMITAAWRTALLGALLGLGYIGVQLLGELSIMRRVLEGACDLR